MDTEKILRRTITVFGCSLLLCGLLHLLFAINMMGGIISLSADVLLGVVLINQVYFYMKNTDREFGAAAIALLVFCFLFYTWRWLSHQHMEFPYDDNEGNMFSDFRKVMLPFLYLFKWVMSLISLVLAIVFAGAGKD